MLKDIEDISFQKLTRIVLWRNKITSFESIGRISFPLLEILNIDDNYAYSARSLRKINTPNLNLLQISNHSVKEGNNPIKDVEKIVTLNTSHRVNTFTLDYRRD